MKPTIWLVQNAMFQDEFGYDSFIASIDFQNQRRIPLDYCFWQSAIDLKLTGIENPKQILPFGTRPFISYAIDRGWNVFWNKEFNYSRLRYLGKDFINGDMMILPLSEIRPLRADTFFLREAAGFNIVKGKVISKYAFEEWVATVSDPTPENFYDWHPITKETLFAIAISKPIYDEYRVWIIDNKVVTSSQYVVEGVVDYINSDDNVKVNSYAQSIADSKLFEMDNYVLDIFRTDRGLQVGEVNCIHCSGFYAMNSMKMVDSLIKIL